MISFFKLSSSLKISLLLYMLAENEIQFITEHSLEDVSKLAFAGTKYPNLDLPKLLFQIQARQKLKEKLPHWVQQKQIYFPPQLALEQSSSEKTALFKSQLVSGRIIDLTGGMGVDDWAFAQNPENQVTSIEIQEELHQITAYNHKLLGLINVNHFHADGMEYLKQKSENYDWIYVDPARRDQKGKKVFLLKDCSPDATQLLPYIKEKTGLLIKTSPMLDISLCVQELEGVSEVYILCVKNEIKELVFKKYNNATLDPLIQIWELDEEPKLLFSGRKSEEKERLESYSPVQEYLYEPHVGILKAGFFKSMQALKVEKIAPNTHLYTSKEEILAFPGRSFRVIAKGKLDAKWILPLLEANKANITCRNAPLNPIEVQKKLKITDGGKNYLFVYKNQQNETEVSICQKTYDNS